RRRTPRDASSNLLRSRRRLPAPSTLVFSFRACRRGHTEPRRAAMPQHLRSRSARGAAARDAWAALFLSVRALRRVTAATAELQAAGEGTQDLLWPLRVHAFRPQRTVESALSRTRAARHRPWWARRRIRRQNLRDRPSGHLEFVELDVSFRVRFFDDDA